MSILNFRVCFVSSGLNLIYRSFQHFFLSVDSIKCYFLLLFICLSFNGLVAQNAKLFLVAGQSNAVGQGDATLSPACVAGTAFEYNDLTNQLQHLQDPMGQTSNSLQPAATGSIGPAFAKTLNALTNKTIYMVSAARGGSSNGVKAELSSYGTWDQTGSLLLFNSAVAKVKNAIQTTGLALSGIIWMQGERDANAIRTLNQTEAEYQAALENLIARFRAQFGPKLPFYIVLTGLQGVVTNGIPTATATESNYAVRRVQMAVAAKIPNVFVVYKSTDTFFDKGWMKPEATTVHYLQPAYNQIGDSVARFVATVNYDTIANIEPIPTPNSANLQLVVDNTDAGCTFDTPWATSTFTSGFYGANYTQDGSTAANPEKWAKWTPNIPAAGKYRVYMQWTSGAGRPAAAPVEILNAVNTSQLTVDQTVNGGKWNYLGTYSFTSGTNGYVKLFASAAGSTIADAVLFEQLPVSARVDNLIQNSVDFKVCTGNVGMPTRATLTLLNQSSVSLLVYNTTGQLVNNVLDGKVLSAGFQQFSIDTPSMPQGLYLATLSIDGKMVGSRKFLLKK